MSNLRDALEEAITWPSSGTLQLAQAGWRKVAWEYDRALAAPQPEPSAGLDVERLARAILAAKWYSADSLADAQIAANSIATQYDRLTAEDAP